MLVVPSKFGGPLCRNFRWPDSGIRLVANGLDIALYLGIAVHDHIIIGKKGNASMKGLLLI